MTLGVQRFSSVRDSIVGPCVTLSHVLASARVGFASEASGRACFMFFTCGLALQNDQQIFSAQCTLQQFVRGHGPCQWSYECHAAILPRPHPLFAEIMGKKMETTIMGYIGIVENEMDITIYIYILSQFWALDMRLSQSSSKLHSPGPSVMALSCSRI